MPAGPRSAIVLEGEVGFYHCMARCVRRAWLCGDDPLWGQNFDHRKEWVRERLSLLAEVFAIDVCAYAMMPNHMHLLLRLRPDVAEQWSDAEVARRWLRLAKPPVAEETVQPSHAELTLADASAPAFQ